MKNPHRLSVRFNTDLLWHSLNCGFSRLLFNADIYMLAILKRIAIKCKNTFNINSALFPNSSNSHPMCKSIYMYEINFFFLHLSANSRLRADTVFKRCQQDWIYSCYNPWPHLRHCGSFSWRLKSWKYSEIVPNNVISPYPNTTNIKHTILLSYWALIPTQFWGACCIQSRFRKQRI